MIDLFPDETFDIFSDEHENTTSAFLANFFNTPKVIEQKEEIPEPTTPKIEESTEEQNLDTVPDDLKQYITQEVWDSYSCARRESFSNMFKNPNSFFYRNRPPGDPQKMGGFTPEEEEQFIQRINYFRNDLKVYDKLWGLFAVPLKGRLGYQCMSFYRHLIEIGRLKKIKPKTDGAKKTRFNVSPEVQSKLEQEALDFIQQCLSLNKPITEPQAKFERQPKITTSTVTTTTSDDYSDSPADKQEQNNIKLISKDSNAVKKRRKNHEYLKLKKYLHEKNRNSNSSKHEKKHKISYIHYAPDPITNIPMENPLLDQYSGIVLDKSSWIKYFRNEIIKPYNNICARQLSDLLPLTPKVFAEYRNQIVNIFI